MEGSAGAAWVGQVSATGWNGCAKKTELKKEAQRLDTTTNLTTLPCNNCPSTPHLCG